jgi:hypothetical protein
LYLEKGEYIAQTRKHVYTQLRDGRVGVNVVLGSGDPGVTGKEVRENSVSEKRPLILSTESYIKMNLLLLRSHIPDRPTERIGDEIRWRRDGDVQGTPSAEHQGGCSDRRIECWSLRSDGNCHEYAQVAKRHLVYACKRALIVEDIICAA